MKTVLLADDDPSVRTVIGQALKRAGYGVEATDNPRTLYEWAREGRGDVAVTDVRMPGGSGLELVTQLKAARPDMKVIVISAQNALANAISAAERGAVEYLPKPFDLDDLIGAVAAALGGKTADQDNDAPEVAFTDTTPFVVGSSPAMREVYRTIARLVHSDLTVLISGESGTGKEVAARALHASSPRKNAPFVAVNVAAIPRELIESELFGHEKGAFTGATQRVAGKFEQAGSGTLFLDEIGDMPFEAQTRLLRVLQEGEFTTVGGRGTVKARARIIAATNKDLPALVAAGKFREDLYYRLNVIPLRLPPLRDRREDIPALVRHFCAGTGRGFSPQAMEKICAHDWPGNVRELQNFVRRTLALSRGAVLEAETIVFENAAAPAREGLGVAVDRAVAAYFAALRGAAPPNDLYDRILAEVEAPLITRTLRFTGGNQIRAAEILGLNRNTLRKKIRDLGLRIPRGGDLREGEDE